VRASGNSSADRRVAEVMARYEIAKQIRVRVESEMVDRQCEGGKQPDCANEIRMVIKQSVDEVLAGSKVVDYAEGKGMVTAIAVLPKGDAGAVAAQKAAEAEKRAREVLGIPSLQHEDARKEYLKAVSYDNSARLLGTARKDAAESLQKLDQEIKARQHP